MMVMAVPGGSGGFHWHVGELRCAWGGRWYVLWLNLVGWSARPAREAGRGGFRPAPYGAPYKQLFE